VYTHATCKRHAEKGLVADLCCLVAACIAVDENATSVQATYIVTHSVVSYRACYLW